MRRFVNPGNTAFEVAVNSLLQYTGQILSIGINYDKKIMIKKQKSIAVRLNDLSGFYSRWRNQ